MLLFGLEPIIISLTICSKIHIFTDHNPLTYWTQSMSKSAKLVRWSLALQTFGVDVKYTNGKLNVVADCL